MLVQTSIMTLHPEARFGRPLLDISRPGLTMNTGQLISG